MHICVQAQIGVPFRGLGPYPGPYSEALNSPISLTGSMLLGQYRAQNRPQIGLFRAYPRAWGYRQIGLFGPYLGPYRLI